MQKFAGFRKSIQFLKKNKSRLFWLWIGYQAVKGSLTLFLIWIPLFLFWKESGGLSNALSDWSGLLAAFFACISGYLVFTHMKVRYWLETHFGQTLCQIVMLLIAGALWGTALFAAFSAPADQLWTHEWWHSGISFCLIAMGAFLIVFGVRTRNPFAILAGSSDYDATQPGISIITRHPMLWGIAFLSLGQIITTGRSGFVALFAFQCLFAIAAAAARDSQMKRRIGPGDWKQIADQTSFIPNPVGAIRYLLTDASARRSHVIRLAIWTTVVGVLVAVQPDAFGQFNVLPSGQD